jgi:hypothetical protein
MRAPNTTRRDAARVNSLTGRSGNVSRERLEVERFVEQRHLQPCTVQQAATAVQLTTAHASKIVQRLVKDGMAVKVGMNGQHALYVWHTHAEAYRATQAQASLQSQAGQAPSEPPIRNSNAPNGSQEYWREHIRQMMAPARAELQA